MKKHILIIDDNKGNLVIVRHALGDLYDVTPLVSGKQALDCLGRKHIDLILLDLYIPEMNGKEVFLAIRENKAYDDIPIVFISGETNESIITSCLELGAADFIPKPFTIDSLLLHIHSVLKDN